MATTSRQPTPRVSLADNLLEELLDVTIATMKNTGYDHQRFAILLQPCFASRIMFFRLLKLLQNKVECCYFVGKKVYFVINGTAVRFPLSLIKLSLAKIAILNCAKFDGVIKLEPWLKQILRERRKRTCFNIQHMSDADIRDIIDYRFVDAIKCDCFDEKVRDYLMEDITINDIEFTFEVNQRTMLNVMHATMNIKNPVSDYLYNRRIFRSTYDPSEGPNVDRHQRIFNTVRNVHNLVIKETFVAGTRAAKTPFIGLKQYYQYVKNPNLSSFELDVCMVIKFEEFIKEPVVLTYPLRFKKDVDNFLKTSLVPIVKVKIRYEWNVKEKVHLSTQLLEPFLRHLLADGFKGVTANEGVLWTLKAEPQINTMCIVEFKKVNYFNKQFKKWPSVADR